MTKRGVMWAASCGRREARRPNSRDMTKRGVTGAGGVDFLFVYFRFSTECSGFKATGTNQNASKTVKNLKFNSLEHKKFFYVSKFFS
ncbi:MAG: hypothetical protein LBP95_01020 [Deltaproteobacteria bacterium]|jgi:hypothetical protein|nr:hypothetical protein [Deltaproteobacteria bacterium]